jgi:hypothetical protein
MQPGFPVSARGLAPHLDGSRGCGGAAGGEESQITLWSVFYVLADTGA